MQRFTAKVCNFALKKRYVLGLLSFAILSLMSQHSCGLERKTSLGHLQYIGIICALVGH